MMYCTFTHCEHSHTHTHTHLHTHTHTHTQGAGQKLEWYDGFCNAACLLQREKMERTEGLTADSAISSFLLFFFMIRLSHPSNFNIGPNGHDSKVVFAHHVAICCIIYCRILIVVEEVIHQPLKQIQCLCGWKKRRAIRAWKNVDAIFVCEPIWE